MPRLAPLIALACLLAPAAVAQWQLEVSSDGSLPSGRHEAAYVAFEGEYYLMGGRGVRPVDRYDPVAQTWTELGQPPLSMHHYQPVVHDGEVWVLCAFQGGFPNETPVPHIWRYDPALDSWTQGPLIPPARNRGAAAVVAHDGFFYVIGGNTQGHAGGYVPWFDRYDPSTDTWTALPDAPHARDHFTAVSVGARLVAAGGRQTDLPDPFLGTIAAVDVYDLTTGQWTSMPEPIPTERAGTMTVACGEHVIVIGGETSTQAHAETEALDLNTGEWLTLPALIDSRHSGGAVIDGDFVYVASGAGNNGGAPELQTQERLDLGGLLPTSSANLLTNAAFDDGLLDWDDQGDLALLPDGGIAGPALQVQNGHAGQTVAVAATDTYTLSGVARQSGSTGAAELVLEWFDGVAGSLGSDSLALAAGSLTTFALTATSPAGAASVELRVVAGGDRVVAVDDLVLRETPGEVPVLGVPANPWVLGASTLGPVTGQLWDPAIDHSEFAPAATLDVFLLGFFPINVVGGPGTLLVDLGLAFLIYAAPGTPLNLHLPNDPMLVGLPLRLQGASIEPTGKHLTNALAVTIQGP